jgi:DNA mismatch repair protein MutS
MAEKGGHWVKSAGGGMSFKQAGGGVSKKAAGPSVTFTRIGDFHELYGEEATAAAKALGSPEMVYPTRRRRNGEIWQGPSLVLPYHAIEGYVSKLRAAGFKVNI